MAWLKFDTSTPEKPEVFSITVAMGWDDPDLTVGKLLKVWRWFDQHTNGGNAAGVTLALLDRVIGVTGFAQAMANVGWLTVTDTGLALPNFERHSGETAKTRALTAKRVAKSKSNAKANDQVTDEALPNALPREEKRRSNTPIAPTGAEIRFERFWAAYPRKVGKDAAKRSFEKRKVDSELLNTMLAALLVQKNSAEWVRDGGQFIPHPSTWLSQGRWQDEGLHVDQTPINPMLAGAI